MWFVDIRTTIQTEPCPDCLGTKKCAVHAASGEVFEADCWRCRWHLDGSKLKTYTYTPSIRQLTIGSVRIDTNDRDAPVSYMCKETGVGSGSVYRERDLRFTEEGALDFARIKCEIALFNEPRKTTCEVKRAINSSTLTNASIRIASDESRKYRFRLQEAQEIVFDETLDDAECRVRIKEFLNEVPGTGGRII